MSGGPEAIGYRLNDPDAINTPATSWWSALSPEEREAFKAKARAGMARYPPQARVTRPRKKPIVKFRGIVIP